MCVAAESAFPKPKQCPHLMTVDKDKSKLDMKPHEVKYHEALQNALISVRQAADWGMGTFQASFKRLTLRLYHGPHERSNLLCLCVHLQQFRIWHVACCWSEPNLHGVCVWFVGRTGRCRIGECIWCCAYQKPVTWVLLGGFFSYVGCECEWRMAEWRMAKFPLPLPTSHFCSLK